MGYVGVVRKSADHSSSREGGSWELWKGFGYADMVMFEIALYTYVADGYMHVASQVFAGVVFMRSLMTAAFPIFMPTMYENLGAPWATSILGT